MARFVQRGVILLLGFGWRDVADGLQKSSMVEPVDAFQGGELNRFEAPPWPAPMNDLGLVETVDRFGERVVVRVADTSDGRLDPGFRQSLRILDRHVLNAPVRVVE